MNRHYFLGLGVLLLAAAAIWSAKNICTSFPDLFPDRCPSQVVTVKGLGGGSKAGLLADPDVTRILRERYRLQVDYTTSGSLVLDDCPDCDFLWPGNEADIERWQAKNGAKANYDKMLQSPLVFYSWDEITDCLGKAGLVQKQGDTYYMPDVGAFLQLNADGRKWGEIGCPKDLFGRVGIVPADPTKADSANVFAAYIATMLNSRQPVDELTLEQFLPGLNNYFGRLGFLLPSTSALWAYCVPKGVGNCPIFVGYESLGIELIQAAPPAVQQQILQHIRMIYPQPTVWFSHPIISQTANGKALARALIDPDIQDIAWTKHGFRSALPGGSVDPRRVSFPGIAPDIISVMPLPAANVLDRITRYLLSTLGVPPQGAPAVGPQQTQTVKGN